MTLAKQAYYFSHDSNARNDDKILKLRMKHGWRAYGLYWALVERLREATNYMSLKDYNLIAFELREDSSLIKTIVEEFGLFDFTEDGEFFYSESLLRRMQVKDNLKKQLSVKGIVGNLIKNGHLTKEQVAKMTDEEIIEFNEDIKATATRPPPDRKATANKRKEKKVKESKVKENNPPNPPGGAMVEKAKKLFDDFRILYRNQGGKTRGLDTEFNNFKKKNKDWADVAYILKSSFHNQLEERDIRKQYNKFVPELKNLQTWINQRCWEEQTNIDQLKIKLKNDTQNGTYNKNNKPKQRDYLAEELERQRKEIARI